MGEVWDEVPTWRVQSFKEPRKLFSLPIFLLSPHWCTTHMDENLCFSHVVSSPTKQKFLEFHKEQVLFTHPDVLECDKYLSQVGDQEY